jgi:hypothetical protein
MSNKYILYDSETIHVNMLLTTFSGIYCAIESDGTVSCIITKEK